MRLQQRLWTTPINIIYRYYRPVIGAALRARVNSRQQRVRPREPYWFSRRKSTAEST